MQYKYFLPLTSMLLLSLSWSCQNRQLQQEQGPQLYAELFVRYLQSERELKAVATFFEGDSLASALPKTFTGGVAFQGSGMETRPLPGGTVRYNLQRQADYAEAFPFRFTNEGGKQQEYSLAMTPLDTFFVVDGKASKTQGMVLYAKGGELQADESLVFFFSDTQNRAATFTISGPHQGEEYRISRQQLKDLSPGPHYMYLVKKKRTTEEKGKLSVLADVEFYTRLAELEVTP